MAKQYNVTWEMPIEADSPREAAEIALRVHRDPSSIATFFVVEDENEREFCIDVCDGGELDCSICGVHQSDYEALSHHYDWHNDQNEARNAKSSY